MPTKTGELRKAAGAWDDICERMPIAVYVCDLDGLIVQFNERAKLLWGRAPKLGDCDERFCGSFRLMQEDGTVVPHARTPMADVLRTGHSARDLEIVIERPDGSRVAVLVNIDPLYNEEGEFIGAVNCFQDISRLKHAESELQARERWYRELLEALPAAIYTTDAEGRITFFNQAAVEMSGSRPQLGSDKWCVTWQLYQPDGTPLPHEACPMAVALKEGRPVRGEEAIAERPDGSRVPFIPYPTPLYDPEGVLIGAVNMLVDISERKEAESRQIGLVNELNHRVKNTLATVQSLAAQSMRGSAAGEDVRAAFEARLMALSCAHDQLTRGGWQATDLAAILHGTLAPYRDGSDSRIRIGKDPVSLPPQAALTLAMVFHELAANAAKYGSLSAPEGALDVTWAVADEDGTPRLRFQWQESGGPRVEAPRRSGFGLRLTERSITRALKGSLDMAFGPSGVRCTMDIPLPDSA
ncbi:MAG: HWE histidine kinase domain-containing protein [Gammaproteobacteria bacterium]